MHNYGGVDWQRPPSRSGGPRERTRIHAIASKTHTACGRPLPSGGIAKRHFPANDVTCSRCLATTLQPNLDSLRSRALVTESGCWEWQRSLRSKSAPYGTLSIGGKQTLAHRCAFECVHGPIPEGLCVCHHCDNPRCINPSHLFLGTNADNMRDAYAKGRLRPPAGGQNRKLTGEQEGEVCRRVERGESRRAVARALGVSERTVRNILARITG